MSLLNNYQKLQTKLKDNKITWLQNIHQQKLAVETVKIDNQKSWQWLNDFEPIQGWLQTLDKVNTFTEQVANLSDSDDRIISGECINKQGQSLHIRQQGSQLIMTTYTPNTGKDYLYAQHNHQLAKNGKPSEQQASYQIYWNPKNTAQPEYSRFIGFTDIKTKGKK